MENGTAIIVDDDKDICIFVDEVLADEGYLNEIAINAEDALLKIRNKHFDIALLDIRLPDISGIALLEIAQLFLKTTKIIMITAVNDADTAVQSIKLGALNYIVKPFTAEKLRKSILETRKIKSVAECVYKDYNRQNEMELNFPEKDEVMPRIDAIAFGVDAQVDYFDFHSRIVTERTVSIAQDLGFPEKDIRQWEMTRNRLINNRIKSKKQ